MKLSINLSIAFFLCLCVTTMVAATTVSATTQTNAQQIQLVDKEGIDVEFSIISVSPDSNKDSYLKQGDDVKIEFKIIDKATKNPVKGLHPAVWIDSRMEEQPSNKDICTKKVSSFLTGTLGARADFDLNVFYVLALNEDATISIVDPLFGFGGSQLLAMVMLKSPGADWVNHDRLNYVYVSMPKSNEIAVVDSTTWQIKQNISAGSNPGRIRLQPDKKYLWVSNAKANFAENNSGKDNGGITVIDTDRLKKQAFIKVGMGPHEITFSEDSQFAYIISQAAGTLSIVDIAKMEIVKELAVGEQPTSIAYSNISQAVYVSNAKSGEITVIDGKQHKIIARIKDKPGLGMIRFVPGSRVGLVVNTATNSILVIDPASNQIIKTGGVEKAPYQITFSETLAYVRSLDSELVLMIPFEGLEDPKRPIRVIDFSSGEAAIGEVGKTILPDTIAMAPEGSAVLVSNPIDKMIYYYSEGMAAPMGSFKNYGHIPKAVMVVDRSLQETKPGVYSTSFKFIKSGKFDVAFLLDAPRMVHCFDLDMAVNPKIAKEKGIPIRIKPLLKTSKFKVGDTVKLQFKVIDNETNTAKTDLINIGVLTSLVPGIWQKEHWATNVGNGIYSIEFKIPQSGLYYIFYKVPKYNLGYNQLPYSSLYAADQQLGKKEDQ